MHKMQRLKPKTLTTAIEMAWLAWAKALFCHSSKSNSVLLIAYYLWLRKVDHPPYWMDYRRDCSLLPILYLLCSRIGGYLSRIDAVIAYHSYGSVFTRRAALRRNPPKHFSVEKMLKSLFSYREIKAETCQ